MGKIVDTFVGELVGIACEDGGAIPADSIFKSYVGRRGLALVLLSEYNSPGQHFVRWYPYEPERAQRCIRTGAGDLEEAGSVCTLTTACWRFVWRIGRDLLSAEEIDLLTARMGEAGSCPDAETLF